MAKLIFIGSTCADVTLLTDHLPAVEEDVNAQKLEIHLGGCAHNAAHAAGLFHVPFQLASPVGTGIYGQFVENALNQETIPVWQKTDEANGACFCLVDGRGNRSFISVQGAEYHFQKEWLETLDADPDTWIYICGLELENETGENIVSYLEHVPSKVCFAAGPRLLMIKKNWMDRILQRADLIHLNAKEAKELTDCDTVEAASEKLHSYHHAAVVITDGAHPVTVREEKRYQVDAVPCHAVDGTGAGDSHIGTILACLCRGMELKEAVKKANTVSSIVCRHVGACIDEKELQVEKDIFLL